MPSLVIKPRSSEPSNHIAAAAADDDDDSAASSGVNDVVAGKNSKRPSGMGGTGGNDNGGTMTSVNSATVNEDMSNKDNINNSSNIHHPPRKMKISPKILKFPFPPNNNKNNNNNNSPQPPLGITMLEKTIQNTNHHWFLSHISPTSPFMGKLMVGDKITSVNGVSITGRKEGEVLRLFAWARSGGGGGSGVGGDSSSSTDVAAAASEDGGDGADDGKHEKKKKRKMGSYLEIVRFVSVQDHDGNNTISGQNKKPKRDYVDSVEGEEVSSTQNTISNNNNDASGDDDGATTANSTKTILMETETLPPPRKRLKLPAPKRPPWPLTGIIVKKHVKYGHIYLTLTKNAKKFNETFGNNNNDDKINDNDHSNSNNSHLSVSKRKHNSGTGRRTKRRRSSRRFATPNNGDNCGNNADKQQDDEKDDENDDESDTYNDDNSNNNNSSTSYNKSTKQTQIPKRQILHSLQTYIHQLSHLSNCVNVTSKGVECTCLHYLQSTHPMVVRSIAHGILHYQNLSFLERKEYVLERMRFGGCNYDGTFGGDLDDGVDSTRHDAVVRKGKMGAGGRYYVLPMKYIFEDGDWNGDDDWNVDDEDGEKNENQEGKDEDEDGGEDDDEEDDGSAVGGQASDGDADSDGHDNASGVDVVRENAAKLKQRKIAQGGNDDADPGNEEEDEENNNLMGEANPDENEDENGGDQEKQTTKVPMATEEEGNVKSKLNNNRNNNSHKTPQNRMEIMSRAYRHKICIWAWLSLHGISISVYDEMKKVLRGKAAVQNHRNSGKSRRSPEAIQTIAELRVWFQSLIDEFGTDIKSVYLPKGYSKRKCWMKWVRERGWDVQMKDPSVGLFVKMRDWDTMPGFFKTKEEAERYGGKVPKGVVSFQNFAKIWRDEYSFIKAAEWNVALRRPN